MPGEDVKDETINDQQISSTNEESVALDEKRLALRSSNLEIKEGKSSRPDPSSMSSLDGSIKKNTGFIKKLKSGVIASNVESLKKECLSLKLQKYIEEVASTLGDGMPKNASDVMAVVELASLLYTRFDGFLEGFTSGLMKQFQSRCTPPSVGSGTNTTATDASEKEENMRISTLRSSLRMLTELYLVGLTDDDLVPKAGPQQPKSFIPYLLFAMMVKDLKYHQNLTVILTFVRFYGSMFLPPKQESESEPTKNSFGIVPDILKDVQKLMNGYFESLKAHLVKEHKHVRQMEKANHDYFIAKGEAFEDRQARYEKALKSYEKLHSSSQTLASLLGSEMPELQEEDQIVRIGVTVSAVQLDNKEDGAGTGVWEDEETKSFYEGIYDLQIRVPPIVLGRRAQPKDEDEPLEERQEDDGSKEDSNTQDDDTVKEETSSPQDSDEKKEDDEVDGEDESTLSNRGLLKTLLESLQNALNRDTIDELAVQLALLNSKGMRKKLVQTVLSVPRQRPELLPYYGRLVATVNPYMPDVGSGVVSGLESEFKFRQRKKEQVLIEEKLKNVRFIGELTKFKVASYFTAFHIIKVLLDDFSHHNIDLLCAFLETCGRFLYRTPETHVRMANFLDILNRKKNVQNMESRHAIMIENVIYECNPPETQASVKKVRPPTELFVRKLIYQDLSKDTAKLTLKLLRKLNWDDPAIRTLLQKIFFKIHKVKFSTLPVMAFLLAELCRYYPEFGIAVVDNTLEEIRVELERNLFKHNQRRLATIAFLGELYNYRMVTHKIIIETLFRMLKFGHQDGVARAEVYCPIDAPNDFFRLRLCCKLLDVCGPNLGKNGSRARKLDHFLTFMQVYMFSKTQMPMDVEFFLTDTLDLVRPKLKLFATFEEAVNEVNRIASVQRAAEAAGLSDGEEDDDQIDNQDAGEGDDDMAQNGSHVSDPESEDEVMNADEDIVDDEDVVVHADPAVAEEEEDDEEFDREYSRLMQESLESRRNEKRTNVLSEIVPSSLGHRLRTSSDDFDAKANNHPDGTVKFTVLTRKGNKQQAKFMALPSDSTLAMSTLAKKQEEEAERAHLKELTLGYEQSQREEAAQEIMAHGSPSRPGTGKRVLFSTGGQRRGYR